MRSILSVMLAVIAMGSTPSGAGVDDATSPRYLASMDELDPVCHHCYTYPDDTHDFTDVECQYGTAWTCFSCITELCPSESFYQGPCPSHHQWCDKTLFDEAQLEAALADGNGSEVVRQVSEYPDALRLNVVRSALQVYDCRGIITGQYPLDATMLERILAQAERE